MVNGAGLAMATMDIIKYAGGSPANFLDVGGGANAEQVKNAFRILLSDKNVKAVLINIFGGILRCDTLATGVVAAARDLNIKVPIVVRMEGTNVELGRQILKDSGFNFTVADGHEGRRGESGETGGVGDSMSVLVDQEHAADRAGLHRQGRHLPRAAGHRLRHQRGGRRGARARAARTHLDLPVFNTVAEAVKATGANASVIFVPPPFAADAIMEAADAGLPLVVCITEGIPTLDMVQAWEFLQGKHDAADRPQLPRASFRRASARSASCRATSTSEGHVGVVSRSGTLTYEAVGQLTKLGIGQSTCIGIGGDPIIGTNFLDALQLFNEDPGHARHRHDRRDRRQRGRDGGGVHQGAREEAGGRLHRRADRAAGTPHGPRRRHHLRRLGQGAATRSRPWKRRASRCARRRPTSERRFKSRL